MSGIRILNNFACINIFRSLNLFENRYKSIGFQVCYLFSENTLRIDEYVNARARVALQYKGMETNFFERMREAADLTRNNLIFTQDLKDIVHLANNVEDLTLVKNMMMKFSKQNEKLRFGNFIFGPIIMRMFHFLNQPTEALNAYNDKSLSFFFDNMSSHVILMDLLLKNGMCTEVIDVYHTLRDKQLLLGKYPKPVVLCVFGACLKLNTPEYFAYAQNVWNEMIESGSTPLVRTVLIAAYLALNFNKPQLALDIISVITRSNNYCSVKVIKILAYMALNKIEDAVQLVQSVLLVDEPNKAKQTFSSDIIDKVRENVLKDGEKALVEKFNRIEKQLVMYNHITQETFETFLFSKITYFGDNRSDTAAVHSTFSEEFHDKSRTYERTGLTDMI